MADPDRDRRERLIANLATGLGLAGPTTIAGTLVNRTLGEDRSLGELLVDRGELGPSDRERSTPTAMRTPLRAESWGRIRREAAALGPEPW